MPSDSVQDSTRYVVSDVHHGSVLPGERLEMNRDVYLRPGADVRGGVWSNALDVVGPDVNVSESIYSQSEVTVSEEDEESEVELGEDVTFGACLTTPDTLRVNTGNFKTRFLSDIYAEKINLSGSFIFGNIYSKRAVIRDSVIIGGVFCEGKVDFSNCFVHTFQAHRAEIGEDVSMFAPFAVASEEISLASSVSSLTFADAFRKERTSPDEAGNTSENSKADVVQLYEDDIFEVQSTRKSSKGDGAPATQKVLSMTERILDSSLVHERLKENKSILRKLALRHHIDQSDQETDVLSEMEEALWERVQTCSSEESEERPSSPLESLFKRFDISG